MEHKDIIIKMYWDDGAAPFIDAVADLRIAVFREYPYLYDGDKTYEKQYLSKFLASKDSLIAIAFHGKKVIGAFTGLPLALEAQGIIQPWIERSLDIADKYYFSEALILKEYRGQGIGRAFFDEAEAFVKSKGTYRAITFATVIRPDNHPNKPQAYQLPDGLWEHFGYNKLPEMICHISWKEIGEPTETNKPLIFWIKELGLVN